MQVEEMIKEDTSQEILKSLERHEDKPQPVGEESGLQAT